MEEAEQANTIKWRVKTQLDMVKDIMDHLCQEEAVVVINNHRPKDSKFMWVILTQTLTTSICYKLSKESIHLALRPKLFVIPFLEYQKAMDSLNLVLKKSLNEPCKRCKANKFLVDQLR